MPPKMTKINRHDYLQQMTYRYAKATTRRDKTAILTTAEQYLNVGRKYLIRYFARPTDSRPPKPHPGRAVIYGPAVLGKLKTLWLLMGQPCGKLMQASLSLWIPSWEKRHGALDATIKTKLQAISPAQIDRLLRPIKMNYPARRSPHPANEVRRQIPIRKGPWEASGPGWFEADTVHHSGTSGAGQFIRSLCMTDIYSGWTEVRPTWTQSDHKVHQRLAEIEKSLPMPLLGFDTDNGSEMINEAVLRYLRGRESPIELTRSRPYHSNDNAHVEQKNRTHVREMFGYERFDHLTLVEPLNELQSAWSLLCNLYRPTLKLLSKERQGGKVTKRYAKHPQTPCQRIQQHPNTSQKSQERLAELLAINDPISLQERVERLLKSFFELRTKLEGERERAADLVRVATGSGAGEIASLRSPISPTPTPFAPQTKSASSMTQKHPHPIAPTKTRKTA